MLMFIFRAVLNAHGAGAMFHETPSTINVGWGVMYGITAILGAWGAGTLGQSDWTRYANRRYAPTLSQLVAAPITIMVTATIGIVVTSAANDVLGEVVWNPIYLLADMQEHYHSSPRARAGVFFASVGMVATQLSVSRPALKKSVILYGLLLTRRVNRYPSYSTPSRPGWIWRGCIRNISTFVGGVISWLQLGFARSKLYSCYTYPLYTLFLRLYCENELS
jgi:hypothetical protein